MSVAKIPVIVATLFILAGCSGPYQGIKLRARSPAMTEAFRKLSLALRADGYELRRIDPEACEAETEWRESKDSERADHETRSGSAALVRIDMKLAERGSLYDIFLAPSLQSVEGVERIAEPGHPLWEKWKKVLGELVRKEEREED